MAIVKNDVRDLQVIVLGVATSVAPNSNESQHALPRAGVHDGVHVVLIRLRDRVNSVHWPVFERDVGVTKPAFKCGTTTIPCCARKLNPAIHGTSLCLPSNTSTLTRVKVPHGQEKSTIGTSYVRNSVQFATPNLYTKSDVLTCTTSESAYSCSLFNQETYFSNCDCPTSIYPSEPMSANIHRCCALFA